MTKRKGFFGGGDDTNGGNGNGNVEEQTYGQDTIEGETPEQAEERRRKQQEEKEKQKEEERRRREEAGDDDTLVEDPNATPRQRALVSQGASRNDRAVARRLVEDDDLAEKRREEARVRKERTTPSPYAGGPTQAQVADQLMSRLRREMAVLVVTLLNARSGGDIREELEKLTGDVLDEQRQLYDEKMRSRRPAHSLPEEVPDPSTVPVYDERIFREERATELRRRQRGNREAA